jgi:hypothetical protein
LLTLKAAAMFNIENSRNFYEKLLEDLADFQDNPHSARHAINCAITAYHMHEWVWGDWLKTDYATWQKLGIRDKETFLAWVDQNEPWFRSIQDLCNGSKHFDRSASGKTKASGGVDSAAFDEGAFDTLRLEIEADVLDKKEWIDADILLETVVKFWRNFFLEHSPYKASLPTSRAHLTDFK